MSSVPPHDFAAQTEQAMRLLKAHIETVTNDVERASVCLLLAERLEERARQLESRGEHARASALRSEAGAAVVEGSDLVRLRLEQTRAVNLDEYEPTKPPPPEASTEPASKFSPARCSSTFALPPSPTRGAQTLRCEFGDDHTGDHRALGMSWDRGIHASGR